MSLIPMKDTVVIVRSKGYDRWGEPLGTEEIELKCRIDYQFQVVKNDKGEDVVAKATLLFNKIADIQYSDKITFTDEFGVQHTETPISISPLKNISGNPIMTRVVV
ncbi:hypothetical protein P9695_08775 [Weizmannia sp. CD-2023]|uniref:hypothetical protein n=1 Tax=Heyndrickxia TaxID=2837504 RepID=UPI002E1B6944|nr:hypothetical protein [Weizmannia sp. CD-2023]MED4899714.1 hypothetical protein [Weizmannia sp. CD-2023]